MTPQTETVTLSTTQPTLLRVNAYGANTLRLSCVGDLSTGFDTLKAELHDTRAVGETPLAEVEYVGTLGVGPHVLEFTAAQMNQMPADDRVRTKALYLVVLGRNGSGDDIVKSTLASIDLTLLQSPAGDTAPAPPAPATYATQEYVDDAVGAIVSETNLSASRTSTAVTVISDTGTDAELAAADASNAGVMTAAQFTKLAGIAAGATANSADATLLARANHTGTQAIATISGLQVALDAKDSNLNDALSDIDAHFARLSMADDYANVDPTGATDSKAGLQAAIDAVATAGGGILMLTAGATYRVDPGATGIGLLLRTGVRLAGLATILFTSSTASAAYTGISPYAHNTTSTAYGAHELDIQDIALGCDDTTSAHTHSLLGVNHCPKASIRNVRLLGAYYHGVEINKSRHIHITGCRFSGDYRSSQLQLDIGSSGVISTTGAAGTNYTVEDIVIDKCYFGPHDDASLAHAGAGFTSIELTHTSTSMILRNVRITNSTFYSYVENAATAATQRGVIGSASGSAGEISGLVIQRNHFISLAGTGNAYGLFIAQSSPTLIRGIDFSDNTFTGGWKNLAYITNATGGESATGVLATATEFTDISGIRIVGNTGALRLNGNGVSGGGRVMRLITVSGAGDAVISGNVITLDNVIDANWTSGAFVATTPSHFILANHVRDLTLEDNRFSVLLTSPSFQFYGIVIAVSGFEASGIAYNQRIRGNNLTAANSTGLIYAGYVHSSSVLRSAWPNPPKGRGDWQNNTSTNVGGSRGTTFFWPIGGGTNGVYTYGLPDWRPGYDRIGEKIRAASAPGGGWRSLAGTAFASLTNEEQHHWQYQLAQGATALPTETGIYVRLSGSEQNPIALNTSGAFDGTVGAATPSTVAATTGTFSGQVTASANGAASAPAVNITGVPFAGTGTTSYPLVYINETGATASTVLSTSGTLFGVNGNGTADLMNLLKDGASMFKVNPSGIISGASGTLETSGSIRIGATSNVNWNGRSVITCPANGTLALYNNATTVGIRLDFATDGTLKVRNKTDSADGYLTTGAITASDDITLTDAIIGRKAVANLRQGATDAASPVSQTFSVQNVATGTSNTAGADRYYDASQGTGTGPGGAHIFRTAPAGSTGTAQNALAAALTIASSGAITTSHGVTATRSFTAGSAYGFTWQGKTVIASPTNGTIRLTNAAESVGATIDVTTADTFKFRGRTNAADAAITAGTITTTGVISTASNLEAGPSAQIIFASRSKLRSAVDGNIQLGNFGDTDFGLLQFGGTTSSFPSIKRSSTALAFRLADDSADCDVTAGKTTLSGPLITAPQALSGAGAVNLTTGTTAFTSTGAAQALTLADGTNGQIKTIVHVADGGSGVLTPTTASGYTNITFTNVGDSVTLQFLTGAGWCIVGIFGAVAA